MITFQIAARVNADRRLVLTLPAEVPLGPVEIAIAIAGMNQVVARLPEPHAGLTRADAVVPDEEQAEVEESEVAVAAAAKSSASFGDAACLLVDVPDGEAAAPVVKDLEDRHTANGAKLADAPAAAMTSTIPWHAPRPPASVTPPAAAPPPAPKAPPRETPRAPVAAVPLRVGTILGDYRLLRKLGSGPVGAVYAAHQISVNRQVALKVLDSALDPDGVRRFVEQAQRLTRLEHHNILRCHAVAEEQGHHFLVEELMEEGTLASLLKTRGPLSVGDSLYVLLSCCQALQYAHEMTAIHGGIKPENILLTGGKEVKVGDFGLAPVRNGVSADDVLFLAPEQAGPAPKTNVRSDLYALGCVLYTALTGSVPFAGGTAAELLAAKQAGTFTPLRQRNGQVPERLDAIVARLLSAAPEQRYQSCAALSLDLEALRLANSRLSLGDTGRAPAPPRALATPPPPRKLRMRELESVEGYWYASMQGPDGQPQVRKVTYRQVLALLKSKAVDAETPASRHRDRGFEPLASYSEFQQFFGRDEVAQARASPKPRDPADVAGWLHEELAKKDLAKVRRSRRGFLSELLGWRGGRGRWLVAGGAAALLVGGFFAVNQTFWFWRLKRKIRNWFH